MPEDKTMNENQAEYVAQIFRQSCAAGVKMTPSEVRFLKGLLDKMDNAERAGTIAAIIRIMLGEE